MRKSFSCIMAIYLVALLIGTLFLYSIFACDSASVAYAADDMVDISYSYNDENISHIAIAIGTKIPHSLSYDTYQQDANLLPNYVLEWHIGSVSGELLTTESLFYFDTTLFGVAVLYIEPPKDDENETPIDNNDTPIDNNETPIDNDETPIDNNETPIDNNQPTGGGTNENETNNASGDNDSEIIKTGQESTSEKTYNIAVESDNDKYTVSGNPKKDEKITVTFKEYKEGYIIKNITVLCGGSPVVFSQNGKEISFYMPEGDVNISCIYEANLQENEGNGILNGQEILALSLVGGIAAISGTFFIIKSKLAKKKTVKKDKNKKTT